MSTKIFGGLVNKRMATVFIYLLWQLSSIVNERTTGLALFNS